MDKGSIVRIVVYLIAWISSLLVAKGKAPLQIDETYVTLAVTFVISSWAVWKNNYLGWKGRLQKKALAKEKLE